MAKGAYFGVNSIAKKVKKMYIGISGVAHKVKKAYIGIAGKARLWFSGEPTKVYVSSFSERRSYSVAGNVGDYAIFADGMIPATGMIPTWTNPCEIAEAYDNNLTKTTISTNRNGPYVGYFHTFSNNSSNTARKLITVGGCAPGSSGYRTYSGIYSYNQDLTKTSLGSIPVQYGIKNMACVSVTNTSGIGVGGQSKRNSDSRSINRADAFIFQESGTTTALTGASVEGIFMAASVGKETKYAIFAMNSIPSSGNVHAQVYSYSGTKLSNNNNLTLSAPGVASSNDYAIFMGGHIDDIASEKMVYINKNLTTAFKNMTQKTMLRNGFYRNGLYVFAGGILNNRSGNNFTSTIMFLNDNLTEQKYDGNLSLITPDCGVTFAYNENAILIGSGYEYISSPTVIII